MGGEHTGLNFVPGHVKAVTDAANLMSDGKFPRVVLTTHGRFHSFNLAEQLQCAGLLRAIFTPYPKFKLRNARVDPALIRSFPWVWGLHRVLANQPVPNAVKHSLQRWSGEAIDVYANLTRPDCDVLMALSGGGLYSGRALQREGGRYVCDRGSPHMRFQMEQLREEYDRLGLRFDALPEASIAREEMEYAEADAITVPSRFAARTFIERGLPQSKIHVIPYGVDLADFRPAAPRDPNFRVLFVGSLSVLKESDTCLRPSKSRRSRAQGSSLSAARQRRQRPCWLVTIWWMSN